MRSWGDDLPRETQFEQQIRYQGANLAGDLTRSIQELICAYTGRTRLERFVYRWRWIFFGWFCGDILLYIVRWIIQ